MHFLLSLQSHSFLRHFGEGGVGLVVEAIKERQNKETRLEAEHREFLILEKELLELHILVFGGRVLKMG